MAEFEANSTSTPTFGNTFFLSPVHVPDSAMSFAGRRRGNKAKKGVQFTVMVVGMCCI